MQQIFIMKILQAPLDLKRLHVPTLLAIKPSKLLVTPIEKHVNSFFKAPSYKGQKF